MTDMGHLNEEDLVLHFYGELDSAGVTRTESHLAGCGDCRASYTRLQRVMAAVDTLPDPVLPEAFERVTWARLQPSLRRSTGWRTWFVLSPASLALASAVLILVTGAFFAGRLSRTPEPAAVVSADQFRERVLLTDLGEHLDRSQMALVELVSVDEDATRDISGERSRAEQLVADSRLYRQTAESTGDVALSELLDEIERVLTEVAASPQSGTSRDLADVRRRIESRDLLFQVRIVSSEIRERQRATNQRQAGPRS